MGDKPSKTKTSTESPAEVASYASKSQEPQATSKTAGVTGSSPPTAAAASPPAVAEKIDVLINSTTQESDLSLAKTIQAGLEKVSITSFIHHEVTSDAAKKAGKMVVDAKGLVYIASNEAAQNNIGQDLISLAYISNKPIFVAARDPKADLIKKFVVGMKMTLHQIDWNIITENSEEALSALIEKAKEQISVPTEGPGSPLGSIDTSALIVRRGGRLNTKLRQQTTVSNFGDQINGFWDRNFNEDLEVPWYKFQKCFLDDYETQLSNLLDEQNIPWLLDMLKKDVFEGADSITKDSFMNIRGETEDQNAFWKVISQIAVEKFNMKEVFDMNSSVRLTAIEKLAAFQNPAVVEALLKLLDDKDPNVRAVAAISLGRTGCTEERVIDSLIELLKDGDRIVRQSACLSLGAMKAVKAIPHIGNIWRNDFISVVRNAARTALENMNIPEAKDVLSVTKVLEEEIEALAGNQAAV